MASFVTVICRLPSGIKIELHDINKIQQQANSNVPSGQSPTPLKSVTLNGQKHDPTYHPTEGRLLGRAGRTQVDADFWDAWLKQNADSELVQRRLVFAESNLARADSAVKELSKEKTGLEGVDQNKLPSNVKKLERE